MVMKLMIEINICNLFALTYFAFVLFYLLINIKIYHGCVLMSQNKSKDPHKTSLHTEQCHDSMTLNLLKQKVLKRPPW